MDAQTSSVAARTALYVSKRLQRPVFAVMCLVAAQLVISLSGSLVEPTAQAAKAGAAVRVHIQR